MTDAERIDRLYRLLIQMAESLGRLSVAMQQLSAQQCVQGEHLRQHALYLVDLHEVTKAAIELPERNDRLDGFWGNPN